MYATAITLSLKSSSIDSTSIYTRVSRVNPECVYDLTILRCIKLEHVRTGVKVHGSSRCGQ